MSTYKNQDKNKKKPQGSDKPYKKSASTGYKKNDKYNKEAIRNKHKKPIMNKKEVIIDNSEKENYTTPVYTMEDNSINENEVVAGRNAILEALKAEKNIDVLYISEITNAANPNSIGSLKKIKAIAVDKKIIIKNVTPQKLAALSNNANHQGVVGILSTYDYFSVEDIMNFAKEKNEEPFIILCDEIEDPHNLGAIIRTAESCGAHGVIIPKRHSATVNVTVFKTSAGAANLIKVARVSNLVNTIKELQEQGVWFYCADMYGKPAYDLDFAGGVGLVIGSEGKGVSRLVKESSDFTISLPMKGQINSLNASVAAGVLMYEVVRKKG